ncbi:MAG TPA: isoprenylcysteine carboxylmethyltransferase family protein [Pirellulaceae bacterium]|nr:isoprenylcysteine carboxylmethyltransferase family protein [Pirellulaceae bacterium]
MYVAAPQSAAPALPSKHLAQALDLAERAIVTVVYLGLVARLLAHGWYSGELTSLLLLPSEGLVVVFLLFRRRTTDISLRGSEWLLALTATLAPMLVERGTGAALVPTWLAAGLMLMGLIVQIHAKITLGRSFGCVPAHRGLQLSGPYRFVRHPMYAGYLLSHIAFLLVNPTLQNVGAYVLCYALQIPRLMAEERLLAVDCRYREYQARVKSRLIPGIF